MARLLDKSKKLRRTKRGGRKFKYKNENVTIFSNNAAGLVTKTQSLKSEIKSLKAAIFTIQETHFNKKGKFKIENYEIFESIRKKHNGGTMIGVNVALKPILISEYCEDFELLVVEIKIRNQEIRIISGYGPQESWDENDRMPFFVALEQEIAKSELAGKSIIICMDTNSKLGPEIISNDPHKQSSNGQILAGIIERHGLVVANGLVDKCEGVITRRRKTIDTIEESIIDHVAFSEDLKDTFISLVVDEDGQHALNKTTITKKGVAKITQSDHNPLISNFSIPWIRKTRVDRIEIYNLKNKESQNKFKDLTSKGSSFCDIVNDNDDINDCTVNFINKLDEYVNKCFRKIRVTERQDNEINDLFEKRKLLRSKNDEKSKLELEKVEDLLSQKCAESNYSKIKEEIANIECEDGGINSGHLWKLKKKLSPKCRDPPTAMLDSNMHLVTDPYLIEKLALKTYKERLQNRPMKEELIDLKESKEELCQLRLELAGQNKSNPWTMDQLEVVLRNFKNNKSRDPMGFANELFKPNTAGSDLKKGILKLMNKIKNDQKYPEVLESCNISSIYKQKGSRNDFNFYRGIFRVPILRSILDRLIYNDEYDNIDRELSDSNVGARKKRNIRDNLLVMNAITNSVINGNASPIDIQVFDVEKCFDGLWLQECINDLYDTGLNNDKLPLLFLENKNAKIAVKTSTGISERDSIQNIVMQGTVWGSLMCTVTMDKLGKLIYNNNNLLYKYKGTVDIPSLGMVDDIMSIQECSEKVVMTNSVVNAFIESKKLKFSDSKCNRIHVSKKNIKTKDCPVIKVHEATMNDAIKEKYLGDIVHENGKVKHTIEDRRNKGFAIVSEILAILNDIPLGKYKMEVGLKLRQAMLINGILFNSEVWHDVTEKDLRMLETVDEHLLRSLVKGHSKIPLEFLYLEAGALPVRFIISTRRMIYLQTLMRRNRSELTRKVYEAQTEQTTKGDYVDLLKADFDMIDVKMDNDTIEKVSVKSYKKFIKLKVRKAALKYLNDKKETHSKIRHIEYRELKTQEYLTSALFSNEETQLLYSLRSRSLDCRENFKSKYSDDFLCQLCGKQNDSQQHILICETINAQVVSSQIANSKVVYEDIFKDYRKQKEAVVFFTELITIRSNLLIQTQNPSTSGEVLRISNDLHCIDYYSFGK